MQSFEGYTISKKGYSKPWSMNIVFGFLYTIVAVNQLLECLYTKVFFEENSEQMQQLSLIVGCLKSIAPFFLGFIIDHIQYSTNLLMMGLFLTFFSQIFYVFYILKLQRLYFEYSLFAVLYEVTAGQSLKVLILTFIARTWDTALIQKHISNLYQCYYLGEFLSEFLIIPIIFMNQNELATNQLFQIYMYILMGIVSIEILFSHSIFKCLKYYSIQKYSYLKLNQPDEQKSFLRSLKIAFNSRSILVIIVSALIISSIQPWVDMKFQLLTIYFLISPDQLKILKHIGQLIYALLGILILHFLAKIPTFELFQLKQLSTVTSSQLLAFFLITLLSLLSNAISIIKIPIYALTLIIFQFSNCLWYEMFYEYLSSLILCLNTLSLNIKFRKTQALVFGLFSSFTNILNLLMNSFWFASAKKYQLRDIYQIYFVLIYSIAYALIAFMLSKIAIFKKLKRVQQRRVYSFHLQKGNVEV